MGNIDTAISWFRQRQGRVKYSMASRYGPGAFDCSSSVYYALRAGGFFGAGKMGNTDTLFSDLPAAGFQRVSAPYQRGDIFLWGKRHSASGRYGHTGMFVDGGTIIHCSPSASGIGTRGYQAMLSGAGNPPTQVWRHPDAGGGSTPPQPEPETTLTNVGEVELLGIKEGKVVAQGWHFSQGKPIQYLEFYNAETGALIQKVKVDLVDRKDIKDKYPNTPGVEKCGFDVSLAVPNNTAVYVKGIRTDGTNQDELIFSQIIIFEQAFDAEVETYAETQEAFWFAIFDGKKEICRGKKILNDELSWSNELLGIPTTELVLPISYKEYLAERKEVKIFVNRKVFHGITIGLEEDKTAETVTVSLVHVIAEWNFRQISTNLAVKTRTINDIYSTLDFRYPNWNIEYLENSAQTKIDYVYSRQGKLDGLTKTCMLTDDLFWRVGFNAGRTIDIGSFGEKKDLRISLLPSGESNIQMLSDPTITHEYEGVVNMATVYGEKSDGGMSSLSLREVYEENGAQIEGFPVVILKNGINNERGYDYIEFTKLAPNNDIEYSIIDEEGIALEGGVAIEGTFAFNDLGSFNTDSKEISEEDRAKASKTAYDAAVKRLKQSRRKWSATFDTTRLPHWIKAGDQIKWTYDNEVLITKECSNYLKKILAIDDWFYLTNIEYRIDKNGNEYNAVTVSKFLQVERESDWQ